MRLSLTKIKHQPALIEEYRLCEPLPKPESLGYQYFDLDEPVCFLGTVANRGDGLFMVDGHYQTEVTLRCSRCLSPFKWPVSGDIHALYGAEAKDDYNGEVAIRDFCGDVIDISELLMGEISFSLPMQPLCREDCRGLCPVCGVDLNLEKCSCEKETMDPRWEKLANLKLDRKA
jgi:uncharacterized protein